MLYRPLHILEVRCVCKLGPASPASPEAPGKGLPMKWVWWHSRETTVLSPYHQGRQPLPSLGSAECFGAGVRVPGGILHVPQTSWLRGELSAALTLTQMSPPHPSAPRPALGGEVGSQNPACQRTPIYSRGPQLGGSEVRPGSLHFISFF